MPKIADAAAARKLRESVIASRQYTRTKWRRQIRDRQLESELGAFKKGLSENIQKAFIPWMDQEPDNTVRDLKHILIANPIEVEVLTRDATADLQEQAQDLEIGIEAVIDNLVPVNIQLLEADGVIGDGWMIYCLEQLATKELAPYADAEGLKAYAESEEPDDDDKETPRMKYRGAYKAASERRQADPAGVNAGTAHDEAYMSVTDAARKMQAAFGWRARVVNNLATYAEEDAPGEISWCMEDGYVPVSALKGALEGYGYALVNGRWVLKTPSGKATDQSAFLIGEMEPTNPDGSTDQQVEERVRYTRFATKDEIAILVEHVRDATDEEPGILQTMPNPFGGKFCGYFLIAGDVRNRPSWEERYVPPVEGLYVTSLMKAYANSAAFAMLAEEAMRDVTQVKSTPKVPPVEGSQNARSQAVKQGRLPASVDELQRTPSTGIAVLELVEMLERQTDRFRFDDFYSGAGSSSETGIHLARIQTAYLTKLQPYQTKRSVAYKSMVQAILTAHGASGKPLYVPYLPKGQRAIGDEPRTAEVREITSEMAKLPIELRITIGAESPETKYAREQALRAQMAASLISRTTAQEGSGVKDPKQENRRIAKDKVFEMLIAGDGQVPGRLISFIADRLEARIQERINRRLPPPPPELIPPPPPPIDPMTGMPMAAPQGAIIEGSGPVTGAASFGPAVQTDPITGAPVAPGAMPVGA